MTLEDRMRALADGDRTQVTPVFEALWPIVGRSCARQVGDGQDAEDAAQNALIRLFAQAHDYDGQTPVAAWALEIAWWECRTVLSRRRRDRTVAMPDDPQALPATTSHEPQVTRRLLLATVEDALSSLSPDQREAIEAWVAGDEGPAASGALARKRRQRGLDRLRAFFGTSSRTGGSHD